MKASMKKGISLLLALGFALLVIAGCNDANAAESVYLPLYEPCPFADDDVFELSGASARLLSEVNYDFDYEADFEEDLLEEMLLNGEIDDGEEGLWDGFSRGSFIGETPGATLASAPVESGDSRALRVDLNHATAAELSSLPGIGPALAERIIDYRRERPFTKVEELQRVRGIGAATMEKLAPLVQVD